MDPDVLEASFKGQSWRNHHSYFSLLPTSLKETEEKTRRAIEELLIIVLFSWKAGSPHEEAS